MGSNIFDKLPNHVAIVMDGNGRWANQRYLPRMAGHRAGVTAVREVVEASVELGVQILTLFAFSSENWARPRHEVDFLMSLLNTLLEREIQKLHESKVKLKIIGARNRLGTPLLNAVVAAEKKTCNNSGLTLVLAVDYGGRWDILHASKVLAAKVQSGQMGIEDITEQIFGEHLALSGLPDPDLLIRTSGEERLSNFLIWQLAYTEMIFLDILWPDFNRKIYENALHEYAKRQRRFGLTGEQVSCA